MNSARSQDTRSIYKDQMYFYMLAMNNPKMKLRNQIYSQGHQKG